jgi:hypothetical protein
MTHVIYNPLTPFSSKKLNMYSKIHLRYPNQKNIRSLIITGLKEGKEEFWQTLLGLNSVFFNFFIVILEIRFRFFINFILVLFVSIIIKFTNFYQLYL